MRAVQVPGGVLHLAESKAVCPHCKRNIPFDELEKKWTKQNKNHIRVLCKCRKYIGIAIDYKSDFVAYAL